MIALTIKETKASMYGHTRTGTYYFDGTLEAAMKIVDAYKARKGEWYAVDIEFSDLRVLPDDFEQYADRFNMRELTANFQWAG